MKIKEMIMKKFFLAGSIIVLFSICASAQPKTASSVTSGAVTVFSDNGYYVKAKNSGKDPMRFSFKYETNGYKVSTAAWAKFPVYTLVSTTPDVYENVTIEGNEERNLFTAPVANDKETEYYIKIIEVYNVKTVTQ